VLCDPLSQTLMALSIELDVSASAPVVGLVALIPIELARELLSTLSLHLMNDAEDSKV